MTIPPDMTGDQFAQGLKLLGWRQVEFAERTGVAASTINRWISGYLDVPTWASAHLRLLLAGKEFYDAHIAPPPRTRRKASANDQPTEGEQT
ncbi:MAG: helix-turn-helix domain-containing protein [Polynucleobacter sp.]